MVPVRHTPCDRPAPSRHRRMGGKSVTKGRVVTAVRLAVGRHCCHIEGMKDWPSRRILALLLGVFLALGMSLSAIEAGEMGVQMAMASKSEEHTSELQSLMRISYDVFCLKKNERAKKNTPHTQQEYE